MLVVFANNQVLIAPTSGSVSITTDPVAVGGNNQATGVTNVHGIFNAAAAGLRWDMEISMDGQTWVTQGPAAAAITATGETLSNPAVVTGVYARLVISFDASAAGVGAATFDIHVNFDRS
jgi:hypothetical protein